MTRQHTFVIFDVGGTLIDFTEPGPFRRFLQDMKPDRRVTMAEGQALLDRWQELFRHRRHEARGLGAGNDDLTRFWRSFVEEMCSTLPEPARATEEMWRRFDRGDLQQLYSDVRPTLRALRQRAVPMAIISNFRPDLEDYLRRLRIRSYFRFVICSSVVGLAKPDRRIFDLAVQQAGVPAQQIYYVGDDLSDDVAGSRNAGLTPLLIDRNGYHENPPCQRLRDLRELITLCS